MRFTIGDEIDSAHCTALHHEFLKCEDAFKDFETTATTMIMLAQRGVDTEEVNRLVAYKTYNAYSRFIHHLYEFILGAAQRSAKSTEQIKDKQADAIVYSEAQRILNSRRNAILGGYAPSWENDISAYPEAVPESFASDFRIYRNKVSVHVSHKRATMSLSDFYDKYHMYLYMIYENCRFHWGLRDNKLPDLKEITDFSVLIKSRK
ncbi:MAG: hypothetical protein C0508_23410 [Cyanobacteria bacterium PR.023]|nr:hypothetical protein [Cyanobacteria bacterium PR.023]